VVVPPNPSILLNPLNNPLILSYLFIFNRMTSLFTRTPTLF